MYYAGIMKNTRKISLFIAIFVLGFGLISSTFPQIAHAATPTLAFAQSGTNSIQISVNGDPNQVVNLYYYQIGSSISNSVGSIGTTNSSGYFSNTLNTGAYNIPAGASVYVVVNGQQSSTATWPSTTGGSIYLSQSNVIMNQGQSTSVSISGGSGNNYYVNSNSNSSVVGASVSGSVLTLNALTTGYVNINVCSLGTTTTCAPLAVTVNSSWGGNNGNNSIYLSQSSITVAPGQTQTVYINNNNSGNYYNQNYYGAQTYYISNNPGSQYFSASISGNTVTVYGNNPGSATINICTQYSGTSCASLYATVSGNYYNGNYNNYNNYNGYNGYNYYSGGYTYSYPTTYTNPVTYTYPATTYTNYSGGLYGSSYTSGSSVGSSVSGVFLSQVPSTGISFGLKMALFTLGLLLWSMFAAFMIARKKELSKAEVFKLANMKKKGLV
ncbi:MAG: Alpha-L-rhamnosidase [Patescibacteria group bacterium]|nr:Alpha-L-rhamnosidase [Patescibacteria group bacterium]